MQIFSMISTISRLTGALQYQLKFCCWPGANFTNPSAQSHKCSSTQSLAQSVSPTNLRPSSPEHTIGNYAQLFCFTLYAVHQNDQHKYNATKAACKMMLNLTLGHVTLKKMFFGVPHKPTYISLLSVHE